MSDQEPGERIVHLEAQLNLTREEYEEARQASDGQILEMVIGQIVRGRKPDVLDAFVYGPIEAAAARLADANWLCESCGMIDWICGERVLRTKPTLIVEKVCTHCRSPKILERN